ncbi:head GIN domain-containing protein [Ferruginibacter sp. HRS2-29]|uniref:head GIN domain-containing protein n=1 Tax=Ferruginibacter sp. HRS2-29 TaxID=2487334 RepID=UPI0020CE6190|nr:head GIN domain-containing protein [Ferruginibacter sp. HRS2-29]
MKRVLFALLAFVALNATAQTKVVTDPNARTRVIAGEFTGVSVATGIELFLTQGNEVSLAVSMNDEKYSDDFKTEIVNGVLKIYFDNNNRMKWEKGRKLKAYLSVKTLSKLSASSGANVKLTNELNVGKFDLRLSSGSEFDGAIKATSINIDQSSGSEINLSGSAGETSISVSSGASFDGYGFVTDNCTASASSGADIEITANKSLDASASSGGSIKYKGNATNVDITKSSGGSVRKS